MPTLSVYRNGTLEWQGPVTDYTLRIGRSPENVLVYVFNGGASLYRLVCISRPEGRAKYDPVFGRMAATLKVAPGAQ